MFETPENRAKVVTQKILSKETAFHKLLSENPDVPPEQKDIELHGILVNVFESGDVEEMHSMKGIAKESMLPENVPGAATALQSEEAEDIGIDVEKLSARDTKEYDMWVKTRANGFRFNTNGAGGNVLGGRFQRWKEANPKEKERYESSSIDGKPNVEEQQKFRQD